MNTPEGSHFLLLTDADSDTVDIFLSKFKESSKLEIIKNAWVLSLIHKEYLSVNKLIDLFTECYKGKFMIIRMDAGIDAGWIISKDDSEFIEKII